MIGSGAVVEVGAEVGVLLANRGDVVAECVIVGGEWNGLRSRRGVVGLSVESCEHSEEVAAGDELECEIFCGSNVWHGCPWS